MRDEKLKVLKALRPIDAHNVDAVTVRGQYRAGAADGGAVRSYAEEIGVQKSSTETFVALKAEIANWRWAGVPFYLRTGKRLPERMSEIVVAFKHVPHSIFPMDAGAIHANRLVLRLQPDEGVKQWIMIKDPGPGGMRVRHVSLDMSFAGLLRQPQPGRLRAAAPRRHPRQPDALHAARRGGGGLALDRPDPRRLGALRPAAEALCRREAGGRRPRSRSSSATGGRGMRISPGTSVE